MKEITKTSRLAGQLEKLFRMLNNDMFGGQLEQPIITIQSSARSYTIACSPSGQSTVKN